MKRTDRRAMKKKRITKIISYSLIFLIFFIIFLNFLSVKSDKFFDIIGIRAYTVLSGSMEPELHPGDVTIIVNKNKVNLNKNDVITFKTDNSIITHRIIEKKDEGYVTKGDNNNVIDSFIVKPENIIGKVVFHIPKIGYIIKFLARPLVIAIEMIILSILIIKSNKR